MNPPTIGHQKLVEKIKSFDGDHYVFLSQTQKPKTDPLAFADKLRFAKFFFPEITIGHPTVRTPMDMMAMLQRLGYTDIIYVAGSDRVDGFTKLFNDYNGKPDKSGNVGYKFDSIEVVSAGERDPDADGAEGMSASKMRAAAKEGDLESFTNGTPRPELADEMFKAVRSGMGIKEPEMAEGTIASKINWPNAKKDDKKKKKKDKSWLQKAKELVGLDEGFVREFNMRVDEILKETEVNTQVQKARDWFDSTMGRVETIAPDAGFDFDPNTITLKPKAQQGGVRMAKNPEVEKAVKQAVAKLQATAKKYGFKAAQGTPVSQPATDDNPDNW